MQTLNRTTTDGEAPSSPKGFAEARAVAPNDGAHDGASEFQQPADVPSTGATPTPASGSCRSRRGRGIPRVIWTACIIVLGWAILIGVIMVSDRSRISNPSATEPVAKGMKPVPGEDRVALPAQPQEKTLSDPPRAVQPTDAQQEPQGPDREEPAAVVSNAKIRDLFKQAAETARILSK